MGKLAHRISNKAFRITGKKKDKYRVTFYSYYLKDNKRVKF